MLCRCWPLNSSTGSCCALCPVPKYVACVFPTSLSSSFLFSSVFSTLCCCCSFSCCCCRWPRCQGHKLTPNKARPDLVSWPARGAQAATFGGHTRTFFHCFCSFYLLFFIPLSAVTVVVVNPHTDLDWKCWLAVFLCVLCGKLLNGTDTCPHHHRSPAPAAPPIYKYLYALHARVSVCVCVRVCVGIFFPSCPSAHNPFLLQMTTLTRCSAAVKVSKARWRE